MQKRERVAVRMPAEVKRTLERAAAISGRSLTDFVVGSAMAAALETIDEAKRIHLTEADSRAFMDALTNPPKPNEALGAAVARHEKLIG